jgi:hypothetical protein
MPAWRWSSGANRVTVPTELAVATLCTVVAMGGTVCVSFAALMVMVPDAPFSDCDKVTLLPPANTNCTPVPVATPDVPTVLPRFDAPIVCVPSGWTLCAATLNWNCCPVVERIVIAPSSERLTVPLV